MSKDINAKVKKIVADHLGVEEEKVTDEASFIDDNNLILRGNLCQMMFQAK